MNITIYTDGSSKGNPGPGGWGVVVITNNEVIELGGSEVQTTNNRMELKATIEGFRHINDEWLKENKNTHSELPYAILLCTDSEYVKKGMTEWIEGWVRKGWKTSTKKDVLNRDLWEQLLHENERLKKLEVSITWKYVRGHTGIPGNERADSIATGCADMVQTQYSDANGLQLYRGERSAYPYF